MNDAQKAILDSVQESFPAIDKAARAFIFKLSMSGVQTDIELASEMAGLSLLRSGTADLSQYPAGAGILGAVPEDRALALNQFMHIWAKLNGLVPPTPADFTSQKVTLGNYHPEVTKFEEAFQQICTEHKIASELRPFVAATTALLLVLSGEKLKLLDAKLGQAIAQYHVICGCKTVPFPLN